MGKLLALVLSAAALSAQPLQHDAFEMRPVLTLPFRPREFIPIGDADRDGRPEIYLSQTIYRAFAIEVSEDYEYDTIPLPFLVCQDWDIGDTLISGHGLQFVLPVVGLSGTGRRRKLPPSRSSSRTARSQNHTRQRFPPIGSSPTSILPNASLR